MKKTLSLLLIIALVISMMGAITVSAKDEVIFSDDFEGGMSNWSFSSSKCNAENSKLTSDKAKEGKNAVYVKDADNGTYGFKSIKIPVEAGKTYTASADLYNVEGVGGKIFLSFVDKDGKRLSSKSCSNLQAGSWGTGTVQAVADSGAVAALLYITGSGAATGESYIDNVKLTLNGDVPQVSASQTPAPSVSVNAGDVLFTESFENGKGDWKFTDGCEISTENATDGKNSAYVVDESETTSSSISSPAISVKPGLKYTASADFKAAEGTMKIYLKYLDKDKKNISSTSASFSVGKIAVVAPDNAVYAQVIISGNSTSLGKCYVDNIKLTAAEAAKVDEKALSVIAEINAKIKAAKPGDVIEIPDGTYAGVRIDFNAKGTEGSPITLKAKNPGKAIFTGESTIRVTGSYLITEGILFEKATTKFLFVFEAATDHCQIKDSAFINCDPIGADGKVDPTAQQKWIYIRGTYNKVTNCYMRGKTALGMMAEVIRTDASPDYHIIENSYFGDYKEGTANGMETIRIGTSTQSLSGSYSTVQGCFFESCNGEVETISVKSCNNYVLNNTLYNNKGAIVLRHGNDTEVRGNLVIGGDATGRPTGVRVIGENHKVYDNYFYNTPVNSSVLYVSNGNPNPLIHEYLEVKNADVHNNTFVNVDTAIVAGEYAPSATNASNKIIPPQGKIYNNAVISYKGSKPLITGDKNAKELTFENNFTFGKDVGYDGGTPAGISNEKFDFEIKDGYFVPANGLGANIEEIKKAPKSPYDVMPTWVKEQYYDTGKIKFNIVENDPFNNPQSKVEDLFPVEGKINVVLNGETMNFDVEPQLINDRTMVPMRAIFEAFGADVTWDEKTATATASDMFTTIKITENSDTAYVNGKEYKLDSPAVIIDGRFLVPVRFISESFGAKVSWVDASQTVVIEYSNNIFKGEFKPLNEGIEKALTIYALIQSGDDGGSKITNIVDGSRGTKWAVQKDAEGNEGYGIIDLGSVKTLDKLHMSYQAHATRVYTFEIYASENNSDYTLIVPKTSTTNKEGLFEIYDLKGVNARYVKFVGYGNTDNGWNNISELVITEK